jgi:hypothetical protein
MLRTLSRRRLLALPPTALLAACATRFHEDGVDRPPRL